MNMSYLMAQEDSMDYDSNEINGSSELNDLPPPCDLSGNHDQQMAVQICIYSLICVAGLVGNVLVLVTYAFYRKAKTMTDIFLVNVALADLLFVIALPLIIYNEMYSWNMGVWACKLLNGIYSINLYSSMLLLACISGDRYITIVKANRSIGIRTKAQIYSLLICSMIWSLAITLSVPTFVFYEWYKDPFNSTECSLSFETEGAAERMKVVVPTLQVTVGFLVPMLVMAYCYCCIVSTLLRTQNYRRHKAVRVVLVVVVVFILCHLPYKVVVLVHTSNLFGERSCEAEQNILLALSITKNVAYLHCCLNPILYAFIGVKFRNHFCKIMEDLWCFGKRHFSSARSSQQTSELYIPAHKSIEVPEPIHDNPSSFTM